MGGRCTRPAEARAPQPYPQTYDEYDAFSELSGTGTSAYAMPTIIDALDHIVDDADEDGDRVGKLPKVVKARPRGPATERRVPPRSESRAAALDDPSDSASTLTRANAAALARSLCQQRGIKPTMPPAAVTPRSPSLSELFGVPMTPRAMPPPVRLEDRFGAPAADATGALWPAAVPPAQSASAAG